MNEKELYELFDRHFQNKLNPNERENFFEKVTRDPVIQEKFEEYKYVVQNIKLEGFRNESQLIFDNIRRKKKNFRFGLVLGLIVFILAFLIFSWMNSPGPKEDQLFAIYFEPYPNVFTFRSDETKISDALEAYSLKEYDLAFILFDQLKHKSDTSNFYQAMSAMIVKPDNRKQIKALFDGINSESQFHQQRRWYLAISYLMEPIELDSTKFYLEKIKEDEFNYSDSRELLDRLSLIY